MTTATAPRRAFIDELDDAEPLILPDAWTPPARPPLPLIASTVPVIGAVVLWLVTGSLFALLLAGLGPLIAVASVVDGRRGARREKKRAAEAAVVARDRVTRSIERRQDGERRRRWARHPDVAGFAARDGDVWRELSDRSGALVVGTGDVASGLSVSGGAGDAQATTLRARAARLPGAPVLVAADDGLAITGGPALVAAVHRALVLQLCLATAPGILRIVGPIPADLAWVRELPHCHATTGRTLAVTAEPLSPSPDVTIAVIAPGADPPPGCRARLSVSSLDRALLDDGTGVRDVAVEAVGIEQATAIATELADRAARILGLTSHRDEPVRFADVAPAPSAAGRSALDAVVGVAGRQPFAIDLVADGPHAVVAGVTGSGKSELLITWVLALAAGRSTRDVSFLLADFKGGTAFDALRGLPHVTGVITDLDGSGARRAIESLRAEIRWREAELARCGARDILDERVELPRLVVVVDEFAALLAEHPELHAVFGDIAARGRALGLHLILGTQRAAGVIRDSLLANCPLRLSLRVTDAADSRALIGTDEAAVLPGGVASRGLALIRRAADASPHRVRIALTCAADISAVAGRATGPAPRRPWLPDLPESISLADARVMAGDREESQLLIGIADEPERQRQRAVGLRLVDRGLLVVGGPGSGKTTVLDTIAEQARVVRRVAGDGESTWDSVAALIDDPPLHGAVIIVDDLDTVPARLSPDHAQVVLERLELLFRGAGATGNLIVATTQRLTGAAARLGEILPRRLVLATASRAEHLAAGGDPAHHTVDAPPGRGRLGALAVQVAVPDGVQVTAAAPAVPAPPWTPHASLTGFVTRRRAAARPAFDVWSDSGIRSLSLDEYAADPSVTAYGPVVLMGDPDEWQREWRLLARVRADHDLVIDTSCAAEYRVLSGSRDLPPYALPGAGRAWLLSQGGEAVRIVLPGPGPGPGVR
ncbi:FtsK/SpoIIIE domain-containing protein [Microbacterium sp. NPDC055357]